MGLPVTEELLRRAGEHPDTPVPTSTALGQPPLVGPAFQRRCGVRRGVAKVAVACLVMCSTLAGPLREGYGAQAETRHGAPLDAAS